MRLPFILASFFYLLGLVGFPQQQFCYTIDQGGSTRVTAAQDGGFILTKSGEVVKLDATYNVLWTTTVSGTYEGGMTRASESVTGDIYAVGTRKLSILGDNDILIVKLDANSNVIWNKTIGGSETELVKDIQATSDGGCIIAGETRTYDAGIRDNYVIKLAANGAIQWTHVLGGAGFETAPDIIQTSDGNYVYCGILDNEPLLVKLNTTGNVVFAKELIGMSQSAFHGITESPSGELILTGSGNPAPGLQQEILLISLSADGSTINWGKLYGDAGAIQDFGNVVINSSDGGFAITGLSQTFSVGQSDAYLIKTDNTGNLEWDISYGKAGTEWAEGFTLIQTSDNGFLIGGRVNTTEAFLVKTDNQGQSCCSTPGGAIVTNMPLLSLQDATYTLNSGGDEGTWGSFGTGGTIFLDICPACVPTDSTITVTSCNSYTVPSGDETYIVSGIYEDTIPSAKGCDSIITIDLTIGGAVNNLSVTDCDSVEINNTWYYTSQELKDTIFGGAVGGCDSIINTTITINNSWNATENRAVCSADFPVIVHGIARNVPGAYDSTFVTNTCDSTSIVILNEENVINNLSFSECDSIEIDGEWYYKSVELRDTIFGGTSNGCDSIVITDIQIAASPDLIITSSADEIAEGNSVTLSASGATNYEWNNGATTSAITVNPENSGSYCITGTDNTGSCSSSQCIAITVNSCNTNYIFIPTGISPNNDGVNDRLCVFGKECIANLELKIFDRWGNKLYQSTNKNTCWDGTYKGKELNNAVFVYQLEAILTTNETITQKGNILLVK